MKASELLNQSEVPFYEACKKVKEMEELIERLCRHFDDVSKFNSDIVAHGKSDHDPDSHYEEFLEIILEAKAMLTPNAAVERRAD